MVLVGCLRGLPLRRTGSFVGFEAVSGSLLRSGMFAGSFKRFELFAGSTVELGMISGGCLQDLPLRSFGMMAGGDGVERRCLFAFNVGDAERSGLGCTSPTHSLVESTL